MVRLTINGSPVQVDEGSTVLEAARLYGIPIPTLCHADGLTPYGACRLCVVEVGTAPKSRLVSSCTTRATEGLVVRTNSARVERARRLLLELYVATSPQSKRIQDLASAMGVRECRYEAQHEDCIQCGLCVEACPYDALFLGYSFERAKYRRADLVQEDDALAESPARPASGYFHPDIAEKLPEQTLLVEKITEKRKRR